MRVRDVVPARAAAAWIRAMAARTRWVPDYAIATSWPSRFGLFDLSDWSGAPFGSRLAEVTGSSPALAPDRMQHHATGGKAGIPDLPRRKSVLPQTGVRAWERLPTGPGLGERLRQPIAADRTPVAFGKRMSEVDLIRAAGRTLARAGVPGAGSRRTRVDGQLSSWPAFNGQVGRPDDAFEAPRAPQQARAASSGPSAAGITGLAGPEATAALGERIGARLARTLSHPSANTTAASYTLATGWTAPIAAPEREFFVAPVGPSGGTSWSPGSRPATSESLRHPEAGRPAPRLAGDAPMRPHAPTSRPAANERAAAEREPVRPYADGPADVTSVPSDAAAPALLSKPPVDGTGRAEAPAAAFVSPAQADTMASPPAANRRVRIDPIEFAEQLRIALNDDARRQGIEV